MQAMHLGARGAAEWLGKNGLQGDEAHDESEHMGYCFCDIHGEFKLKKEKLIGKSRTEEGTISLLEKRREELEHSLFLEECKSY